MNDGYPEDSELEIIKNWNKGAIPLLFGQPAAMGYGLNLQYGTCKDVCFFNIPDSPEKHEQFLGRIYRPGVSGNVRAHYIVAIGTVDQLKLKRLKAKKEDQLSLFSWIKGYYATKMEGG